MAGSLTKEHGPEAVAQSIIRHNLERFSYLEAARARFNAVVLPTVSSFERPFVLEAFG
jgi:hypothetical protein